jgi:hypothetical protein
VVLTGAVDWVNQPRTLALGWYSKRGARFPLTKNTVYLKAGFGSTAVPVYDGGAAERQGVGPPLSVASTLYISHFVICTAAETDSRLSLHPRYCTLWHFSTP